MSVKLITNPDDLADLAEPWNALAGGMPLRSWDWLATWWKHYGATTTDAARSADRQLCVLAVYDDSNTDAVGPPPLIGIAPWYLDRTAIKGSVLRWLGSGEVCTDHLSLICRPENAARVAAEVAEALTVTCDDWDLLELTAVDADDAPAGALLAALEERECLVSRHAADECWIS